MSTSNELLYGIKRIARFLELTDRQTQHLHDSGQIPTFKLGKIVCALKPDLNQHFATIAAGARKQVGAAGQ